MMSSMLRHAQGLLFSLAVTTFALQASAQGCGKGGAQTSIATDRPQVTNSSIVIPCGSLQFENGFLETGSEGQRTFDLPETSVRFGVARKTELRLTAPNYFFNQSTASGQADGFSDLIVGFKQQLGPTWGKFDVSVIPSVSLPTGADRLSSHGYDPFVQAPWSRTLSSAWTVAGMFSVMWPTDGAKRNVTGQSSFYFDRQITAPWDAYVEYSGLFPQRGTPQHAIDFGTAYKPSPHQQLDLHCSFGLSAVAPDHSIGVGYSVRFQMFGAK